MCVCVHVYPAGKVTHGDGDLAQSTDGCFIFGGGGGDGGSGISPSTTVHRRDHLAILFSLP